MEFKMSIFRNYSTQAYKLCANLAYKLTILYI